MADFKFAIKCLVGILFKMRFDFVGYCGLL